MINAYRRGVKRALSGAAIPAGYTTVTWTSGGVLIQTHGAPGTRQALLFLIGVAFGFAIAAFVGTAGDARDLDAKVDARLVGAGSVLSAGVGLIAAAAAAHLIDGDGAFILVSLAATSCFMLAEGACISVLVCLYRGQPESKGAKGALERPGPRAVEPPRIGHTNADSTERQHLLDPAASPARGDDRSPAG